MFFFNFFSVFVLTFWNLGTKRGLHLGKIRFETCKGRTKKGDAERRQGSQDYRGKPGPLQIGSSPENPKGGTTRDSTAKIKSPHQRN